MTRNTKVLRSKSERTLLTALLLSAPGPVVTGISVVLSYATTLIADFLRRSTELAAIAASWWIFRKLQRNKALGAAEQKRLERMANLFVGGAMAFSGVMMLIVAALRIPAYEPSGNVTMGLIIAVLGLLVNSWFWLRYRALAREGSDSIIAAQQKLYRAKACVDFCVVIVLLAVAIAPGHPVTRYMDILGSVVVACYLLWNGFKTIKN